MLMLMMELNSNIKALNRFERMTLIIISAFIKKKYKFIECDKGIMKYVGLLFF